MNDPGTDPLSKLGRDIVRADNLQAYTRLVVHQTPAETIKLLTGVTPADLFAVPILSQASAATLLAALWLWHDGLNEAHATFQQSPAALHSVSMSSGSSKSLNVLSETKLPQQLQQEEETLSFWHAILHRREGDFSNAKYWYDRCRKHPVFATLQAQVAPIINTHPADKTILKLTLQGWNSSAFVDLIERVHTHPQDPLRRLAVSLQQLEWRLLFDHTLRSAAGTGTGVQFFTPSQI